MGKTSIWYKFNQIKTGYYFLIWLFLMTTFWGLVFGIIESERINYSRLIFFKENWWHLLLGGVVLGALFSAMITMGNSFLINSDRYDKRLEEFKGSVKNATTVPELQKIRKELIAYVDSDCPYASEDSSGRIITIIDTRLKYEFKQEVKETQE